MCQAFLLVSLSFLSRFCLESASSPEEALLGGLLLPLPAPLCIYPQIIQSLHKPCACSATAASEGPQLGTCPNVKDSSNKTQRKMLGPRCKCALRQGLWCFLPTRWPFIHSPTPSLRATNLMAPVTFMLRLAALQEKSMFDSFCLLF